MCFDTLGFEGSRFGVVCKVTDLEKLYTIKINIFVPESKWLEAGLSRG